MSLPVMITEVAKADLDDIWLFIARDDPDAADRFVDLLTEKCLHLGGQPEMGRERPELGAGVRSFPVRRRYLILYKLDPEAVVVLRVVQGSQDLADLL